jgi:hypothetical protein
MRYQVFQGVCKFGQLAIRAQPEAAGKGRGSGQSVPSVVLPAGRAGKVKNQKKPNCGLNAVTGRDDASDSVLSGGGHRVTIP